ncbi:hypothetical protein [Microscilla marina]|uniref:Uncharacterized protein n=1 Tax=Microscilla marina ATCC 23134 TaxID=313606 RepID=A1ZK59_MICM2|nr:hypothetical protein [Microscilla marina]EAY29085.1 hypothetical protein M23134_02276 [Microscilla marina ATCC 23134]
MCFVSFQEGGYHRAPNFDQALPEDEIGVERAIALDDVRFELAQLEASP